MADKPNKTSSTAIAAPDETRRAVVAVAACTPLLAAAVALFNRRPTEIVTPVAAPSAPVQTDSVGYHETEHIRRYYRSTKYF